jgi:hypothetical protein
MFRAKEGRPGLFQRLPGATPRLINLCSAEGFRVCPSKQVYNSSEQPIGTRGDLQTGKMGARRPEIVEDAVPVIQAMVAYRAQQNVLDFESAHAFSGEPFHDR